MARKPKIWIHRGTSATKYYANKSEDSDYPTEYHSDYINTWINNNLSDQRIVHYPAPPPSLFSDYEGAWIPDKGEDANAAACFLLEAVVPKKNRLSN